MFISCDKDGNITGVSSYKFYESCIELKDEDIENKIYDKKTKKLKKIEKAE